jgi:hypothetical protein
VGLADIFQQTLFEFSRTDIRPARIGWDHKMPPGHLTYGVLHMWACHNCGTGGMTTFIESCPECQHRYCSNCIIESATKRVSGYIMKPEDHKPSSGQSGPIYIAASNAPLLDDAQRAEEPFKSASLPWSILFVFIFSIKHRAS